MSVFSWLVFAIALGVFAGQVGYDLVAGFLAERRDRKRREALLAGVRARVAEARTLSNEKRRSPADQREGPSANVRDGAATGDGSARA